MVWDGPIGSEITGPNGLVGFRTDNAAVDLEFFAGRCMRPPQRAALLRRDAASGARKTD